MRVVPVVYKDGHIAEDRLESALQASGVDLGEFWARVGPR